MTIEFDTIGPWPPVREKKEPPIKLSAVLAVDCVTLAARDVPAKVLRQFYTEMLSFELLREDDHGLLLRFEQQRVLLKRGPVLLEEPALVEDEEKPPRVRLGKLIMVTNAFAEATRVLTERYVPCEVLHTDGGLTRCVLFVDPAGNLLQLNETRPV